MRINYIAVFIGGFKSQCEIESIRNAQRNNFVLFVFSPHSVSLEKKQINNNNKKEIKKLKLIEIMCNTA
jgi:hypothetical protein